MTEPMASTTGRAQLPPKPRPATRGRLDVLGALLVTAATGTLTYALIRAGDRGWATATTAILTSGFSRGFATGAVVAVAAAALAFLITPDPRSQ